MREDLDGFELVLNENNEEDIGSWKIRIKRQKRIYGGGEDESLGN